MCSHIVEQGNKGMKNAHQRASKFWKCCELRHSWCLDKNYSANFSSKFSSWTIMIAASLLPSTGLCTTIFIYCAKPQVHPYQFVLKKTYRVEIWTAWILVDVLWNTKLFDVLIIYIICDLHFLDYGTLLQPCYAINH